LITSAVIEVPQRMLAVNAKSELRSLAVWAG